MGAEVPVPNMAAGTSVLATTGWRIFQTIGPELANLDQTIYAFSLFSAGRLSTRVAVCRYRFGFPV